MSTKIDRQKSKAMTKALLKIQGISYDEWEYDQQQAYIRDHDDIVMKALKQATNIGGNSNENKTTSYNDDNQVQ